ncbi:hypothetical protein [Piscinibacter sp.]|uniref:hypothetical protein n=1 Tax=Piscinibacter sp. TaxID=1903157 RepID=UPI002D0D7F92|nr:hypothetical protein [Albitalea sp.]HUG24654.1 hypothetical protein [Albitalea sp.]
MSLQNDAQPAAAEYIPFDDFSAGLPQGRFRIIVNPTLAAPFVSHRTHAAALALALIGPGIAAALVGYPGWGGLLIAAGIVLRWGIKKQAPRILLHLASRVPSIYEQATEHGVMEVRRA